MKIKRKLYPNSPDKEFVLMSVNDLFDFGMNTHLYLDAAGMVSNKENILKEYINASLLKEGLKTPASHLKKTKKQKTEENANA